MIAIAIIVPFLFGAEGATGSGGDPSPRAGSKLKLKAVIKKTAKYGKAKTVVAVVKGAPQKVRGTKLELSTRQHGEKRRVQDRATARSGRKVKLRWRAGGLGLTRVEVTLSRGKRTLAKRRKKVFVIHRVKVIDAAAVTAVPAPGQSGPLGYAGPDRLRKGDIVATGVGPSTPYGFLGVVQSVEGGSVMTEPASLLEALPKGSIHVSETYPPAGGGNRRVPVRSRVQCTAGGTVAVEGTASVSHGIEFDADWGFFSLNSASIEAFVRLDAGLSASAEARASCTAGPTEIGRYPLPTITTFAGPIPIVISPQLVLTLRADGSVSARTSSSITASIEGRAGVRYDHGFSPLGSIEPSFDYSPPALSASAHLGATLTPALDMLIYGLAGPEIFIDAGLSLDANEGAAPWWTLTAPIKAGARLTVPALDLDSGDLVVYEDAVTLAEADTDPAPPTHRATVTWNTDGSDVDLHIWDASGNHAWYGEQDGIPDATLSSDITDGYGPEVFSDQGTPPNRVVTYGLCYYDDHDTGPTTATIDITDPNGSIRTYSYTLAGDKSSVLVGRSPAGAPGYTPPAGWCD